VLADLGCWLERGARPFSAVVYPTRRLLKSRPEAVGQAGDASCWHNAEKNSKPVAPRKERNNKECAVDTGLLDHTQGEEEGQGWEGGLLAMAFIDRALRARTAAAATTTTATVNAAVPNSQPTVPTSCSSTSTKLGRPRPTSARLGSTKQARISERPAGHQDRRKGRLERLGGRGGAVWLRSWHRPLPIRCRQSHSSFVLY